MFFPIPCLITPAEVDGFSGEDSAGSINGELSSSGSGALLASDS